MREKFEKKKIHIYIYIGNFIQFKENYSRLKSFFVF